MPLWSIHVTLFIWGVFEKHMLTVLERKNIIMADERNSFILEAYEKFMSKLFYKNST